MAWVRTAGGWTEASRTARAEPAVSRSVSTIVGRSVSTTCATPWFVVQAGRMTVDGFDTVERRIREHQGEPFQTRSGLPMTYAVDGDRIKISRVNRRLSSMGDARQIWLMGPDATLTDVDQ